jgi:hypothetical protein
MSRLNGRRQSASASKSPNSTTKTTSDVALIDALLTYYSTRSRLLLRDELVDLLLDLRNALAT